MPSPKLSRSFAQKPKTATANTIMLIAKLLCKVSAAAAPVEAEIPLEVELARTVVLEMTVEVPVDWAEVVEVVDPGLAEMLDG